VTSRIIVGDALEVLRGMEADSVDAVITDPPYNIGYGYDIYADSLSDEDYLSGQLDIITECARVTKPGGSILYLNYPEMTARMYWAAPEICPVVPFELLTWVYHQHTGGTPLRKATRMWAWWGVGCSPTYIGEDALRGQYRNPDDRRIAALVERGMAPVDYDWWCYEQVKNVSAEKVDHPCQLPLDMVRRICAMISRPGETVLDPYCGSGTTGVAAIALNRDFIGIELSPEYAAIARRRIAPALAQPALLEAG